MRTQLLSYLLAILLIASSGLSAQETNSSESPSETNEANVPATISDDVRELPEEFKFVQDDIKLVEFLMILKQQVAALEKRNQELAATNQSLTARLEAEEKQTASQSAELTAQEQELTKLSETLTARLEAHEKQVTTKIANLQKQNENLTQANQKFSKQLEALNKQSESQIAELKKQNDDLLAKVAKLETADKESKSNVATLTSQLEALAKSVVTVQETVSDHTSILSGSEENKEIGVLQRLAQTEDRISTHGKELTRTSNDIKSLTDNIELVTNLTKDIQAGVADTKSRLNAISYPKFDGHSSDDGTLALRGNMASETFQKEFHQANQFRVQFYNFTGQEQFIVVNGSHWRVTTGTSYVNVPRGKVRIGYRGEWSTLEDWIVDDDGYFINFTLPIPFENQ